MMQWNRWMAAASSALVAMALATGCATSSSDRPDPDMTAARAKFYEGFSGYHREIKTTSPEAQKWFDQGLQLLYGFNHDEAIRSFRKAGELDPNCAMAWWGVGYAYGMHINNPVMTDEQSRLAWLATQEAVKRKANATPVERTLIEALARRYEWPAPADRSALNEAYAAGMERAWKNFPLDADVGALYAESMMNLQPWDLWTNDGRPKGRTLEIVSVLEQTLHRHPRHPGANHFYIHTVEASPNPGRATPSADRLVDMVPGSGHLVHMPAHIYVRTGRYADAVDANERAIAADEAYFKIAPKPRFYVLYYVHNIHFLAYAAMMEGRYETAMTAARKIETNVPEDFVREYVTLADGLMPTPLHVMIRFGKWEDILNEPEPPSYRLLSRAIRHYARCVAYSATGRTDEAEAEMQAFDALAAQIGDEWYVGNNPASVILPLARQMMLGEMRFRQGQREEAFAALRQGVAMEDELVYDEPPGWMQPVRHALGALLMADGRSAEAEAVYRADLEHHRNNGWSLLGLENALAAQGKSTEAAEAAKQRELAWARADVEPTSSCYCQP